MSNFEIFDLAHQDLKLVKPLLGQSSFKPLRYLEPWLKDDINSLWYSSIEELVLKKQAKIFACAEEGRVTSLITLTNNPWETEILGKKAGTFNYFVVDQIYLDRQRIGEQLLEYAIGKARSEEMDYILCKTCTDDTVGIHALESQGFLLMDTLVDCYYDLKNKPVSGVSMPVRDDGVSIRLAGVEDLAEVVSVAGAAFSNHFGRYHSDERIGRDTAKKIYEEWIRSSLQGYADWTCVAEVDNRIVGYSIWLKPSPLEATQSVRVGHYSIAGIHPDYFGRGLFTRLSYEGMKLLQDTADIVEGPTHINNYGVQLGYLKLGWRVCCDARHSFHKWL